MEGTDFFMDDHLMEWGDSFAIIAAIRKWGACFAKLFVIYLLIIDNKISNVDHL